MPLNWSASEDIAEFFTNDVKTVYGHMDYGKKDPSLGWRFTDAWLSWKKLANEKPRGETIAYGTLLNAWKAGKVR